MTTATADARVELAQVTLPVIGMHCASCVSRVERFVGQVDGVEGSDREPGRGDGVGAL